MVAFAVELFVVAAVPPRVTAATLPLVMLLAVCGPPVRVASGSLSQGKWPSAAPFIDSGKMRTSSATSLSPTFLVATPT